MDWFWSTRVGLACCIAAAVTIASFAPSLWPSAHRLPAGGRLRKSSVWERLVWPGLFTCLGVTAWLIYTSGEADAVRDGRLLIGLIVVCCCLRFARPG